MRITEPKRDGVKRNSRRRHKEELYGLYSPNIIQATESRRNRRAEHVALLGERESACRVLLGVTGGKETLERPGLRGSFKKRGCKDIAGSVWLRTGTGFGLS